MTDITEIVKNLKYDTNTGKLSFELIVMDNNPILIEVEKGETYLLSDYNEECKKSFDYSSYCDLFDINTCHRNLPKVLTYATIRKFLNRYHKFKFDSMRVGDFYFKSTNKGITFGLSERYFSYDTERYLKVFEYILSFDNEEIKYPFIKELNLEN